MKDMSTAPKDGTEILLHIEGYWIEGYWDKQTRDDGFVYGPGEWEVIGLSSHGCGCCSTRNEEPDGWFPLPKTPEKEKS